MRQGSQVAVVGRLNVLAPARMVAAILDTDMACAPAAVAAHTPRYLATGYNKVIALTAELVLLAEDSYYYSS